MTSSPLYRVGFAGALARAVLVTVLFADLTGWAKGGADRVMTPAPREFAPEVQLAPFVVNGETLSLEIHARSKADRRYAQAFAEDVLAVTHETLDRTTGRGLVIVGKDGEPHPVRVLQRFLALAERGELDPSWAVAQDKLLARIQEFRGRIEGNGQGNGPPFRLEDILDAIPFGLEEPAVNLFQIAWREGFDEARVDARFRALTPADLAKDDALGVYEWVFYLPPKDASNRALKIVINAGMKKQEMNLAQRVALRGALVVMRPAVNQGIEAIRKGELFAAIYRARSDYSATEIRQLTSAYMRVMMPDFKLNGHTEHARAVEAVEAQKRMLAEEAANPFVAPTRLTTFDPAQYASFVGDYSEEAKGSKISHRFRPAGDHFTWQWRDRPARSFYPAGPRLLVDENGSMTLEFKLDDAGKISGVEQRWIHRRKTVRRL